MENQQPSPAVYPATSASNPATGEEEEIELGGFEDEFASVMGFTITSLLRIVQRQQKLIEVLSNTNPEVKGAFSEGVEGMSSANAAAALGEWLEECIDEETPEDSMLFQVHEQLSGLAGVEQ